MSTYKQRVKDDYNRTCIMLALLAKLAEIEREKQGIAMEDFTYGHLRKHQACSRFDKFILLDRADYEI